MKFSVKHIHSITHCVVEFEKFIECGFLNGLTNGVISVSLCLTDNLMDSVFINKLLYILINNIITLINSSNIKY